MNYMPQPIDEALMQLAKEYGLSIAHDTHYETINIELWWYKGNIRTTIECVVIGDSLEVSLCFGTYSFWAQFSAWYGRNLDIAKYLFGPILWLFGVNVSPRTDVEILHQVSLTENKDFYYVMIKRIIERLRQR